MRGQVKSSKSIGAPSNRINSADTTAISARKNLEMTAEAKQAPRMKMQLSLALAALRLLGFAAGSTLTRDGRRPAIWPVCGG